MYLEAIRCILDKGKPRVIEGRKATVPVSVGTRITRGSRATERWFGLLFYLVTNEINKLYMMNTISEIHRGCRSRRVTRGSAFVEYFIAAVAMAAAAMWLWQGGNFQGIRPILEGTFNSQMSDIAGSVTW